MTTPGLKHSKFSKPKLQRLSRRIETSVFNEQRWQNYRRERERVKKKGVQMLP